MLSIISGKPGSGKTYHMAKLLVAMLTDWVRFELKTDSVFESTVWSNIVFNIEGINETISKSVGREVNVSHYIHYCDDSFFSDPECVYWWQKFPKKSMIIIDEVHFHLGRKVDYGSLDLESELINWLSTHRHGQQEIYFLTQHTDQFASSILGIADTLFEIVNVKTAFLRWPISVPMADVDTLKRSFGIKTQYYQANEGKYRGRAVRWDGSSTKHLMTKDIFRAYQSHDAGVEASDRPELRMTPWEGLLWFGRRHAWHLCPKLGCIALLPYGGMYLLMAAASGGSAPMEKAAVVKKESERAPASAGESKQKPVERPVVKENLPAKSAIAASAALPSVSFVKSVVKEKKIVMLYQEGVMCDDGSKVSVGEAFDYEGKKETIACVNAARGIVGFQSGKKVRF